MFTRYLLVASLLFLLTVAVAAQGTPGGKTPILTGFHTLYDMELQQGFVQCFDGISTFGWKGNARIEGEKLFFSGKLEDTPHWFFTERGMERPLLDGQFTGAPDMKRRVRDYQTPLFDGNTLNGWILRGKIEAVVEDGAIRLTNGSGSLESEGKYDHFVLQLEYMTPMREDKGVNSGVFFRCIPGETMNGYECQILNNAGESDYKSFIGTDTGGIFRRQVGRNVGPKDGEWNYLTIAAKGNRFATWVNGIQTADWMDDRKPHNNPRNGCRTAAGTIQFQGHDPSTEIWLRNIRIREL